MRDIKFRAWDSIVRTMIYPNTENIVGADYFFIRRDGSIKLMCDQDGGKDGLHEHDVSYPENRFILMQFTGLKDETGVEIYEGDIVEETSRGKKWIFEVVYSAPQFVFQTKHGAISIFPNPQDCIPFTRVLGNIHEYRGK